MNALRKSILVAVGVAAFAVAQVGAAPTPTPSAAKGSPRVVPQKFYAPVYEKAKYGTELSVNDHCPVKHGRLNPNIRPTYVNRQPVGFC